MKKPVLTSVFLSGLSILMLTSCSKKAQPTSITGRVYTHNTDIGHEDLRVWLEVNDGGAGAIGGHSNTGRFIDQAILIRGVGNAENIIIFGSDKNGIAATS